MRRPHPPIRSALARGRMWDLANPNPVDVDFRTIAAGLAAICRFNGSTVLHYSVAQHSVLVARQLPPRLRLAGLLHDAHEAMMGDITRPMREALVRLAGASARKLAEFEMAQMEAVHRAAGLPWPLTPEDAMAVLAADNRVLTTEWRDVMAEGAAPHYGPSREHRKTWPALPFTIRPQPAMQAEESYWQEIASLLPPHHLKPAA
ncbi:hypothetical protein ACT6QH_02105 [Xanthobacter sp. TB0139]|uniref:hypothetical protein n=1 Tax=Xanthobacter sp. TB0139 TaxID=3459178 RepID=UPI00403A493B